MSGAVRRYRPEQKMVLLAILVSLVFLLIFLYDLNKQVNLCSQQKYNHTPIKPEREKYKCGKASVDVGIIRKIIDIKTKYEREKYPAEC